MVFYFGPNPCPYFASLRIKCFYDLRMVWPLKAHERKTSDIRNTCKLGDCVLRVLLPGPCQQARASDIYPSSAKDNAGSNYNVCLCRFCLLCDERKTHCQLSLGFALHGGSRLLYLQTQLTFSAGNMIKWGIKIENPDAVDTKTKISSNKQIAKKVSLSLVKTWKWHFALICDRLGSWAVVELTSPCVLTKKLQKKPKKSLTNFERRHILPPVALPKTSFATEFLKTAARTMTVE